jgi:outer membrane protein
LYQGGGVVSRTRQARYDFQASQESLDAQRRAVDRQVRDAFRGVISTISRVEALESTVVSFQSALESTQAGLEVGTRTMVDVLTVTRSLYDAQRNYSRSRYDYIINGLLLHQAASTLTPELLEKANTWLEQGEKLPPPG